MKVRVQQSKTDTCIEDASALKRGDFVGDGMSHGGGLWSWTRLRVVANDRESQTLVVRFPDGEYAVNSYEEAAYLYVAWSDVSHRDEFLQDGLSTWAADAS